MDTAARGFENRPQGRDGRPFAVGSGDDDRGRQSILRIAEIGHQPPHAIER